MVVGRVASSSLSSSSWGTFWWPDKDLFGWASLRWGFGWGSIFSRSIGRSEAECCGISVGAGMLCCRHWGNLGCKGSAVAESTIEGLRDNQSYGKEIAKLQSEPFLAKIHMCCQYPTLPCWAEGIQGWFWRVQSLSGADPPVRWSLFALDAHRGMTFDSRFVWPSSRARTMNICTCWVIPTFVFKLWNQFLFKCMPWHYYFIVYLSC